MSDQITTAAELDALPVGSVVRCDDAEGIGLNVCERHEEGWQYVGSALHFSSAQVASDELPFTVLYCPDAPARTEPTEEPQRVAPSEDVRQIIAALASRLGHVETHWVPDDRATPMPTAEVLREFDAALTAHDAEVRAQALRLTLAQDAAEASLQLAEPMMDAAAGILADDENSAELPTRQAWNAAFLEIGVAIAYGLLDVAAAIREANHA